MARKDAKIAKGISVREAPILLPSLPTAGSRRQVGKKMRGKKIEDIFEYPHLRLTASSLRVCESPYRGYTGSGHNFVVWGTLSLEILLFPTEKPDGPFSWAYFHAGVSDRTPTASQLGTKTLSEYHWIPAANAAHRFRIGPERPMAQHRPEIKLTSKGKRR
jgi:hypothetical protein